MSALNCRLPLDAKPLSYNITLTLDLPKKSYSGTESVRVRQMKSSKKVVLNAKCLDINSIKFDFGNGSVTPASVCYCLETEQLCVEFQEDISLGEYTVDIDFTGKIVDNGVHGLYICKDSVGNDTVVSHFQPSFARHAFPCWDEPSFKAEFIISVDFPADYQCTSNMPIKTEKVQAGRKHVLFEKTPVMSTYLVGLAVGKFDVISMETSRGVTVRVFTPKGKSMFGQHSLQAAGEIIPYYENFFKVPFMLPKVDIVCVPEHFFYAMENWGMLVFREANLLLDSHAPESRKVEVTQLVGHELAHQWFGNLVTCSWWSDIWLNEGFAEWTQYLVTAKFFPKRKAWLNFLSSELSYALASDGLSSAHPLEVPVQSAAETTEIFDSITYAKGCSLVRMVYNFLGEQNFCDGLALYFGKHAYGIATTADLWAAFDAVSGLEISKVMHAYVSKAGYPLLDCSISKNGVLSVKVETFSSHGPKKDSSREALVNVKVFGNKSDGVPCLSGFSSNGGVVFENHDVGNGLFMVNLGSICRVSYPMATWRKLGLATRNAASPLSSEERFTLQNDLLALAKAGYPGYSVAKWLAFVTNYVDIEHSYAVWKDVVASIWLIGELAHECDIFSSFKYFVQKLLSGLFARLTWEKQPDEEPEHSELRALLIMNLGFVDHEPVLAEAQSRFEKHCSKEAPIAPELQKAIFSVVAFHGGKKEYTRLFQLFDEAPTDDLREIILSAIGCFQDPETRNLLIDWLDAPVMAVSLQCLPRILASMAKTPDGRQAALEFLVRNWSRFVAEMPPSSGPLFGDIVSSVAASFCDASVAELIEVSFDNDRLVTAKSSVEQSCEIIRVQAKWAASDADNLRAFFVNFCSPDCQTFSKLFDVHFPATDS